jgi:hypothetical protein
VVYKHLIPLRAPGYAESCSTVGHLEQDGSTEPPPEWMFPEEKTLLLDRVIYPEYEI